MINNHEFNLWDAYLEAEARGTRERKLKALDAFVSAMTSRPLADWQLWAFGLAESVVDKKSELQIRAPLFERILFPALFEGYTMRAPNCARWLAGIAQLLYKCRNCQLQLPEPAQTELGLLHEAISIDPEDFRARDRLIKLLVERLRYTLHELPSGVLYGIDGATAEQCLELVAELDEFVDLTEKLGLFEQYAGLIQECRFHYTTYRIYLNRTTDYPNYAAYLASHTGQS